jgi:hypothetical protein
MAKGDESFITYSRLGMRSVNLFLSGFLAGWTFFCALGLYKYVFGDEAKWMGGDSIPLFVIILLMFIWICVAFALIYSRFARKTFHLSADALNIETNLLSIRWRMTFPRHAISQIKQVKDGGKRMHTRPGWSRKRRSDSFPSWGLQIESSAEAKSLLSRLMLINRLGDNKRFRTILAKLPYEHSEWLAAILGQWAGITPVLCRKEKT